MFSTSFRSFQSVVVLLQGVAEAKEASDGTAEATNNNRDDVGEDDADKQGWTLEDDEEDENEDVQGQLFAAA